MLCLQTCRDRRIISNSQTSFAQGIAVFEWENDNKFVQSCDEVLGTEDLYLLW